MSQTRPWISWASFLLLVSSTLAGDRFKRATEQAPNGYSPAQVDCPSPMPSVRNADTLSEEEVEWLSRRRNNTAWATQDFLLRANISGLDVASYFDTTDSYPTIGIAFSGGGYRAMMNGAGALAAFDNRTENSTSPGQLGGLLQASTYIAGLSGGSWLVGSIYTQNFTKVESIILGDSEFLGSLWQFDNSILEGPSTMGIAEYYQELYNMVTSKQEAGFNTTITDYWGRSLSYQLVNASDGGPAYTFSSIADDADFSSAMAPMPLIVSVERAPGQLLVPNNSTVMEFNPWEMGSYDRGIAAFAPLRYIGSNFSAGVISSDASCIAGFDNVGFVMGTSSSLFNQAFLQIQNNDDEPAILKSSISKILENLGEENRDIANWPNPFYQYNPDTNLNAESTVLTLVDGGEDLQNIPFHPLLLEARHVDCIIAIDSSADTSTPGASWPNGTAMVATYERSLVEPPANGTAFPSVPGQNTFINLGLNKQPTFFGCDEGNLSRPAPFVVYIPNAPYTFMSNVSTFDLEYSDEERNSIILNGYNVATMANSSIDSQWPACLGCALLSRSFGRSGATVPAVCEECFKRYCWNGTLGPDTPTDAYEPDLIIESSASQEWLMRDSSWLYLVVIFTASFWSI